MSVIRVAVFTWLANSLAILVAVWVGGELHVGDVPSMFVAGAVFSAVNWLVKPIVKLLALPLIVLTLGLALFFVNMLMLALTSGIVGDLHINSFASLAKATLIVWVVNLVLQAVVGRRRAQPEAAPRPAR